jgi:VIT1/CCC1 family predicted Fe2+/Mn2+ transporter
LAVSDYLGRFWFSAEPMFGVVMVVCFTSVIRANPTFFDRYLDVILESALACCIAWGLVDGIFYAWEAHYEAKKKNLMIRQAKQAVDGPVTSDVDGAFDDSLADYLDEAERKNLVQNVSTKLAAAAEVKVPLKQDLITIGAALVLVVGAAIVVIVPFYLIDDVLQALLVSNVLGIALLFFMGVWREQSKKIGKKLITGSVTALLALIITLVTVALGG